jgi:hypothetical protein
MSPDRYKSAGNVSARSNLGEVGRSAPEEERPGFTPFRA